MKVPQNGLEDPQTFEHRGILFAAPKSWMGGIIATMNEYPAFLTTDGDGLAVNWSIYGDFEHDEAFCLNKLLLAAGVLTLDEKGAYRIREKSDQRDRLFHGPLLHDGRHLFFNKERLPDALAYIEATLIVLRRKGVGVADPMPEFQVHLCKELAQYEPIGKFAGTGVH